MDYAKQLIEKGEAYYCFCDQERLDSLKQNVGGKEISVYDKHCLHLSKEEVEANLAAGKPFVIRANMPNEERQLSMMRFMETSRSQMKSLTI